MTKIMVVEDDTALREIYSIRITAEGYNVVSAGDGEEALATAVKEKPDLILSDVMMPKISGFDMLDILRSTPETANIKVVMMTALSGEDQRQRGERLGADRYLVKSQVGIEDVVNAIHEVLGDRPASTQSNDAASNFTTSTTTPATPAMPTAPTSSMPTAPAPGVSAPASSTYAIPGTPAAPQSVTSAPNLAPAQTQSTIPPVNYGQPANPAQ